VGRFLPQPFFTTGQFTLMGKRGSLADAIAGGRRFLHDEFEDLPERRAP
jgi:F0F1-type ATP synthase beta subunit